MAAAIVSLAALVVMMPNVVSVTPLEGGESVAVSGALTFGNVGTQAMFAGVIIGLIATELFVWISGIKKLQIDLGDSIPPSVGKSFNVLIPFILLLSGFGLISAVLNNVFDTNLIQMITTLIQEPLRTVTTGLVGCVILYSLGNFLWLLGIHQSVIYSSILEPLLIVNMTQNMAAYAAGEAIPNIINVALVPGFGMMGGSGSTICLLIATFLVGRNKATRGVAKMAFVPGLFNINEPVIFGYPIVYNISLIIPFILTPALGIIIAYAATAMHFMNECVVYIPWTTPPLLSGYLATAGDWRAILVQALILILGVLLYIPFVKINDVVMAKRWVKSKGEDENEEDLISMQRRNVNQYAGGKMKKAAQADGVEVSIEAKSLADAKKEIQEANIVLLGPQIRYELENVKKLAGSVPVEAIDMRDYGMMNGEKVLKHAMEVMG